MAENPVTPRFVFEDEEQPGLGDILAQAGRALPARVTEGYRAFTAPTSPTRLGRFGQRLGGVAQMVFPFTAPAEVLAGEAAARISADEMTDDALLKRIEFAKKYAPGEAAVYESLLSVPYTERIERQRTGAASGAAFAGSLVPGYTGLARLGRGAMPSIAGKAVSEGLQEVGAELVKPQLRAPMPSPVTGRVPRTAYEPFPIEAAQGPVQLELPKVLPTRPALPPVRSVERGTLVGPTGQTVPREALPMPTAAEVAATKIPVLPKRGQLLDEFGRPAERPRVSEVPTVPAAPVAAVRPLRSAADIAAEKTGGPLFEAVKADAQKSIEDYVRAVAVEADQMIDAAMKKGTIPLEPWEQQAGKIDPKLARVLGRAVLGGVIGSTTQDEAEGKIVAALVGMGLGAFATPTNAKRLWGVIRGKQARVAQMDVAMQAAKLADNITLPEAPRSLRKQAEIVEEGAGITTPIMKGTAEQELLDIAQDFYTTTGYKVRAERLHDDIVDLMRTDKITDADAADILVKYDIKKPELAVIFDLSAAKAGRFLQRLSELSKQIDSAALAALPPNQKKQALQFLKEMEKSEEKLRGLGVVKRLDNIRRGLLVVQMATAMRNLETQVGRVVLDGFVDILDLGLRKASVPQKVAGKIAEWRGIKPATSVSPIDSFEVWLKLLTPVKNKELVQEILLNAPGGVKQYHRMLATYSSDILHADRKLAKQLLSVPSEDIIKTIKGNLPDRTEQLRKHFGPVYDDLVRAVNAGDDIKLQALLDQNVDKLLRELRGGGKVTRALEGLEEFSAFWNTPNRAQEWTTRRAVFLANLETRMRAKGIDLDAVVRENRLGAIDIEDLKAAVDRALEVTYAEQPKFGTFGASFVNAINKLPFVATSAIPFPRFMVNALKYTYEYSPAGFIKLLQKDELAKMAAGDFKTISRASVGSALSIAAWELENSKYSTDTWYLKCPSGDCGPGGTGKRLDIRPYGPYAQYAFVAHIVRRIKDGTFNKMSGNQIIQGVLSANLRAGAGLVIVDSIVNESVIPDIWNSAIEYFSGQPVTQRPGMRTVKRIGGEMASGLILWLSQVKDFVDQYDETKGTFHIPGESLVSEQPGARPVIPERRKEPFLGPIRAKIPAIEQPPSYSPTRAEPRRRLEPALRQLTGISLVEPFNAVETEMEYHGLKLSDILKTTGDPELDETMTRAMGQINEYLAPIIATPTWQGLPRETRLELFRRLQTVAREPARLIGMAKHPEAFLKDWAKRQDPILKKVMEDYFKQQQGAVPAQETQPQSQRFIFED